MLSYYFITTYFIFFLFNFSIQKSLETHQISGQTYVEIEAIHIIDTPLGIQVVHVVVPISQISNVEALSSESVWYIPEQEEWPRLAYLTSYGWFFLSQSEYGRIRKRAYAKKAPRNAQLDVTSLLRLAPSSLEDVQFIKKGSMGAYVYSSSSSNNQKSYTSQTSSPSSDAQLIKSGNLGAYIFTENDANEPSDSSEMLYWLLPAISTSKSFKTYTTRIHDSSLLLYNGMPKLIKLKI